MGVHIKAFNMVHMGGTQDGTHEWHPRWYTQVTPKIGYINDVQKGRQLKR